MGIFAKPALGWATEGRGSWRDSQDLAFSHAGSAEEEEADGGGGAPRDLGWAGAGRGGPGTAPLESRVLRDSPQRTRSAHLCACALLRAWAQARPLALAPTFSIESTSLFSHRDPAERKRNFPPPPSGAGGAP